MKTYLLKYTLLVLIAFGAASTPSHANCFVDYKAKQISDSLKLHYGVMQLDDGVCNQQIRTQIVEERLMAHGWTLLRIIGTIPEADLATKKENADDFFLKY